jgi:short-subunit dehydrogenase
MTMNSIERKTACITGATSGIGAAFAKRFAEQGYDLIITGRRTKQIVSLSNALSQDYNIHAEAIIAELSDEKELDSLAEKVKKIQNLEILVNNAGFAKQNVFHEEDFSTHEVMIKVHNLALIKLCHAALPHMVSKGKGTIINVSSLSAFTPFPSNAVYSASKAFVTRFTESIYLELQGTGVSVQALCPGMTRTDLHEKMGFDKNTVYKDKGLMKAMTPEEVVNISLQCLEHGKVLCVPGGNNKVSRLLLKVLPQAVIYKSASKMMRKKK